MAAGARQDRFVFSARARAAASMYVGLTVVLAVAWSWDAEGQDEYLTAWALAAAVHVLPALVAAPKALHQVAPAERAAWQMWCLGWIVVYSGAPLVWLIGARGWDQLASGALPAAAIGGVAFGAGNTLALRRRAGQRAMLVDLVDILTGVVALVGPLALLVGERVLTAENDWLSIPASLVVIGLVHGSIALVLIYFRVVEERRGIVLAALGFVLVAVADSAAQVAQAVTDFRLPAAPLVGLHALTMGGGLMIAVCALSETGSSLLDALPPQRQVRKSGLVAATALVAMVVMAGEAVVRRDHAWVIVTAVALMMVLLVLSTIRQLLLARETARLYGEVERAADERRELLSEVLQSVDTDRHHAALQLHKQAASLYTAMASFAQALDWLPGRDVPPSVGLAAERVRFDLARRVDASQQILDAIDPAGLAAASSPVSADSAGLRRLEALTRAYVGNVWGDVRRPELAVTVDERLAVDWTHEVVVFRIVQVAVHNVWRHADAHTLQVDIAAPHNALTVRIVDDGRGFDPGEIDVGSGITTMQSLAGFVDGHVEIDSSPGHGTRVVAVLGASMAEGRPRPRPHLRLVHNRG
jgi:signal transduction histidine kinase